jgi:hypothetical protein
VQNPKYYTTLFNSTIIESYLNSLLFHLYAIELVSDIYAINVPYKIKLLKQICVHRFVLSNNKQVFNSFIWQPKSFIFSLVIEQLFLSVLSTIFSITPAPTEQFFISINIGSFVLEKKGKSKYKTIPMHNLYFNIVPSCLLGINHKLINELGAIKINDSFVELKRKIKYILRSSYNLSEKELITVLKRIIAAASQASQQTPSLLISIDANLSKKGSVSK